MANLTTKIKKYAEANGVSEVNFLEDVRLQDDGAGVYIKEWNLDIAEPTVAELNSYEDSANTQEALDTVHNNRKNEYPDIGEQLDMIFKSGILNDTDWAIKIQSIKDKYPKPKE